MGHGMWKRVSILDLLASSKLNGVLVTQLRLFGARIWTGNR